MSYTLQDKRDFFEKDLKTNISILTQSAFNKAVDVAIANGVVELTNSQIVEKVLTLRDMFFNENQGKINFEIDKAIKESPILDWYKEQKVKDEEIAEAQENIIDAGVEI